MNTKTFTLSSSGLQNIIFNSKIDSDFRFIFNDTEIQMKNIFAEFISPKVSRIHYSDPTVNFICLDEDKTYSEIFDQELFDVFKKISSGIPVEIDEQMGRKIRFLSVCIENEDIYNKINELFPMTNIASNIDSCIEYFEHLDAYNKLSNLFNFSLDNDQLIKSLSSQFYLIEPSKIKKLPKPLLYSIVSNENLKITDEDSLLDFCDEIFSNELNEDDQHFYDKYTFYELINFKLLSEKKFNEFIMGLELSEMSNEIWCKLRNMIICKPNKEKRRHNPRYHKKIESKGICYDNNPDNRFKGIIHHLCNGEYSKIKRDRIIKVYCSSYYSSNQNAYDEYHAVNFESRDSYWSSNKADSCLTYDFKERKINPSSYSIRSNFYGDKGWNHLKNWQIEGSNDNSQWDVLDSRENEMSLDGRGLENTFDIHSDNDEFYRYLRIKITGLDSNNEFILALSALEYFGDIYEP